MSDPTAVELNLVRLLAIGDEADVAALPDSRLTLLWNQANSGNSNVYLTAAAACDLLAAAVSVKIPVWSADGQSINRTTQPATFRTRARELRATYANGGVLVSSQILVTRAGVSGDDEFAG